MRNTEKEEEKKTAKIKSKWNEMKIFINKFIHKTVNYVIELN